MRGVPVPHPELRRRRTARREARAHCSRGSAGVDDYGPGTRPARPARGPAGRAPGPRGPRPARRPRRGQPGADVAPGARTGVRASGEQLAARTRIASIGGDAADAARFSGTGLETAARLGPVTATAAGRLGDGAGRSAGAVRRRPPGPGGARRVPRRTCARTRRRLVGPLQAPWTIAVDGLTLELRPTDAGQIGLFPEQIGFWPWLRAALAGRPDPSVLHLFAHTGATTLALAQAGARVTHVDASRPAVAWARRNADLSGLADRPSAGSSTTPSTSPSARPAAGVATTASSSTRRASGTGRAARAGSSRRAAGPPRRLRRGRHRRRVRPPDRPHDGPRGR